MRRRLAAVMAVALTLTICIADIGSTDIASGFALYPLRNAFTAPARWNNTPRTLVDHGIRGLGGGLEYAIAPDFCDRLIPNFADAPKPTCDELRTSIQTAADEWSAGHPVLRFVEVSDRVAARRAPSRTNAIAGAEIDFLALNPREDAELAAYGGQPHTFFVDPAACRCVDGPLTTTAGDRVAGPAFVASDLYFNDTKCFVMDPGLVNDDCRHFPSLVLALLGQAIGLDRPDSSGANNYDNDDDPANPIPIDCRVPAAGLRVSRRVDPRTALNHNARNPQHVPAHVTNDDLGGRNFLYPVCADPASASTSQLVRPTRSDRAAAASDALD